MTARTRCLDCHRPISLTAARRQRGRCAACWHQFRSTGYDHPEYRKNRGIILGAARVCALCHLPFTKRDRAVTDHIVPLLEGGTNTLANLRAVHDSCNQTRRTGRGEG